MEKPIKTIHIAKAMISGEWRCLLLKQIGNQHFTWFEKFSSGEVASPISASTIGEAIHKARAHWKNSSFQTIHCGFRYTLPERDEHGMNALYHQMTASYSSSNGIYFDEEAGNNCYVNFASKEALALWKKLG